MSPSILTTGSPPKAEEPVEGKNVIITRINHLAYNTGQLALLKNS